MFTWKCIKESAKDWFKKPDDAMKNYKKEMFCRDECHNPPGMMVITKPFHHVCPSCGFSVTLYPNEVYL